MITGEITLPKGEYARLVSECRACKETTEFECVHCPDCGRHFTTSFPKGAWFMWSGHCAQCSARLDEQAAMMREQNRSKWIAERMDEISKEGIEAVLRRIYNEDA